MSDMKTLNLLITGLLIIGSSLVLASSSTTDDKTDKTDKALDSKAVAILSLNGKVVDINTGEALAGVTLNIEGTNLTAYSDFEGNFEFKNVLPGKLNIIATFISYEKASVNLNVSEPYRVNVALKSLE